MQQRTRVKSVSRINRYAVLLFFIAVIGTAGCQQPAKPLAKETKQEKNKTGKNGSRGSQGEQGKVTHQGLAVPKTLSRTAVELQKNIISENTSEKSEIVFKDGVPVKYVEKEVYYDVSAAFDDNLVLDPLNNTIYPGAVFTGDSIDNGTYHEITQGKKRKAFISFNLQGVKDKSGKPGITSGEIIPNLAAYRDLYNRVLAQTITYHPSAQLTYEEKDITDEESFDSSLKLGVGFAAAGFKNKLKTGLKLKSGEKKYLHLIKFIETFYSVDVNQEDTPLMTDIPHEVLGQRMPVYVSSVTYGRIGYLFIASNKTWSEIKTGIDAVFKATTTNNVEGEIDNAIKKLQEDSNIDINIIGGGKHSPTTIKEFKEFITKGSFASGNPGQIIKYKLRFLDDNATAHIKYNGKYKAVERTEVIGKIKVTAQVTKASCKGFPSDVYIANISGTIGIQPKDKSDQIKNTFERSATQPASIPLSSGYPIPISPVQPASILVPSTSDEAVLLFDIAVKERAQNYSVYQQWGTKTQVSRKVSELIDPEHLKEKRVRTFTVCAKDNQQKQINFDIEFKGDCEFPNEL